jgi:membrane-associated phospholipid phosphatase
VSTARVKHFLQQHFRREFYFVQARLLPEGLFGLYFTVGVVVFVGAAWLFGGISEDLITGDPLVLIDEIISELFRSNATSKFTVGMQFVSALASATAVIIIYVAMSLIFLWKREWYWELTLLLVVAGGILLNIVLKGLFDRARPGWADPLMALSDPGFPSGHTMMATIVYGFLAVYLMLRIESWTARSFIVILTISLIFLIALSRMYLGAHYLSDVLAAMAAGLAWLALCLSAVEVLRRHRGRLTNGTV